MFDIYHEFDVVNSWLCRIELCKKFHAGEVLSQVSTPAFTTCGLALKFYSQLPQVIQINCFYQHLIRKRDNPVLQGKMGRDPLPVPSSSKFANPAIPVRRILNGKYPVPLFLGDTRQNGKVTGKLQSAVNRSCTFPSRSEREHTCMALCHHTWTKSGSGRMAQREHKMLLSSTSTCRVCRDRVSSEEGEREQEGPRMDAANPVTKHQTQRQLIRL